MASSNITTAVSIQNEINTINSFLISYAQWVFPSILLFGIICNLLNIYVFTRPTLRQNPCCLYFLSSSIAALIYTIMTVPLRTLQMGYNIDPTAYLSIICKLKFFFTYSWRALSIWFLILASIDRFLHSSSNVNIRRWSSFKIAYRLIPVTFILAHLAYSHVPIFYEIILPRRTCSIGNNSYSIFLGVWHLITYGTGPPLVMLIFSLLTIRRLRNRRVMPVVNQSNQESRTSSRERSLVRMVFVQCFVIGLTTTAYAVSQWYTTLTSNQVKTSFQLAKDNLFVSLVGSISVAGHSTTFFVFTLTSKVFRQQLLCRRREGVRVW